MKDRIEKDYIRYEDSLEGMDRRATFSQIILGLIIVLILIGTTVAYCKLFNKKQQAKRMEVVVNEKVSEYFALAAHDGDSSARADYQN
mmetsp:Transcript_24183/g.37200  ORF Transcript_24183/g.37200 Transcript_24183/m.37200 type:complete len:88 (-) Transcript_24183:16-279(-)